MKFLKLLVIVFVWQFITYAQTYPLVSMYDIQFVPDSLLVTLGGPPSPLNGDTVRVRGVVLVAPVVNASTDRRPIVWAGSRWHIYTQDKNGQPWNGIALLQTDTTIASQGTFFDLIDTAQVVEFTGKVTEYFQTTQFEMLINPITPVNVVEVLPKRPDPIELSLTDFMENGVNKIGAEKYEGMYVVIRNVFTTDRNTSSGTFKINDGQGNSMFMYDQSGYFTKRGHRLTGLTTYEPPLDGSFLSHIRGAISTRTDGYYITPLYPGDIVTAAAPPSISSITRDLPVISPGQAVQVSARIVDFDGFVTSAKLKYRVNMNQYFEVNMTKLPSDSTTFVGTIPALSGDSSFVDYYIVAQDNENRNSVNPQDTTRSRYHYFVLNRPLRISDIQYSPFGSGFSGYNNMRVSLSGIVTADTSDLPGLGSTPLRVYMQDGNGPWSGIQINGITTLDLVKGQNITLSGKVMESFDVTRIDSITSLIVNSSNNPLPAAVELTTREIGVVSNGTIAAEKYESMIIKYSNVVVTDDNADGNSGTVNNFGEIFIADTSNINTRVELQDGNHNYHNTWDSLMIGMPGFTQVKQGDSFSSLSGILYYSFSNYKLAPRKADDFTGYVSDIQGNNELVPEQYVLNQNYPNPFNPSTTISFSVPKAGNIKVEVFDILGSRVAELFNGYSNPGNYKIIFDASAYTSGMYIVRLSGVDVTLTKKILLLK
ncbi:MAG: T9SS type A sorting domain-containing protein [Ignavibacteriaceae bacterium]|nr:T9SS type A sorting domain-containing protein [Ignavibacteriaceae bacterium]